MKCPKCNKTLDKNDIETVAIKHEGAIVHTAYICKKCDSIIGMGANRFLT